MVIYKKISNFIYPLLLWLGITGVSFASVEIIAEKGVFDESKGMIIYENNVSAEKLSTGTLLFCDRLEVYVHPVNRKPVKAKAEGNVILIDKKGTVFSDVALFKKENKSVELLGHVKVRTNQLKLDGDRVFYNYKTGIGEVTALPQKQVLFSIDRNSSTSSSVGGSKAKLITNYKNLIKGKATRIFAYKMTRKAILQGDVWINDSANQSEVKADRMELFFDILDQLKEIIANGNFLLIQEKRKSTADNAYFNYDTEIVTLKGNAVVEEPGKAKVLSSTIKMHMKKSKGELEGDGRQPIKSILEID